MIVNASGRSALLAAGLLLLCVSPSQAETGSAAPVASDGESAAPAVVHKRLRYFSYRRYTHRRSRAIIAKTDADRQQAVANVATDGNRSFPNLPPSIANANAQLLLAGVQLNAISAAPAGSDAQMAAFDNPAVAKTDDVTVVAAADQLNDTDRSLREGTQAADPAANAPSAQTFTMTPESSAWGQTSLIGKIFIGFGALLTMASAARMFMA